MGIQLDWQVQADQTQQRDHEDPKSRRERRRNRARFIALAAFVGLVVCVVVGAVIYRLRTVDQRNEANLRAATQAEISAIRIGNVNEFMRIQRSASDVWMNNQRAVFMDYQNLKQAGRLAADTRIVDVEIDGTRGRVIIQETIDHIPYQQAWFYWDYRATSSDDNQAGWRRVPQDATFWGGEKRLSRGNVNLSYYELDEFYTEALLGFVADWWAKGCDLLNCGTPPETLELIIDPNAGIPLAWEPEDGWRLRLQSPFWDARVRVDESVPPDVLLKLADSIAERFIEHASERRLSFALDDVNLQAFDTIWLKYQLRDWLVGQFLGRPSPFMDSIVNTFGGDVPSRVARVAADSQQINVLARAIDPNISSLTELDPNRLSQINFNDFFAWRLGLERQRLQENDLENFLRLYYLGVGNPAAESRAFDPAYRASRRETVLSSRLATNADGQLIALVETSDANGSPLQMTFIWVGDTFLRQD